MVGGGQVELHAVRDEQPRDHVYERVRLIRVDDAAGGREIVAQ